MNFDKTEQRQKYWNQNWLKYAAWNNLAAGYCFISSWAQNHDSNQCQKYNIWKNREKKDFSTLTAMELEGSSTVALEVREYSFSSNKRKWFSFPFIKETKSSSDFTCIHLCLLMLGKKGYWLSLKMLWVTGYNCNTVDKKNPHSEVEKYIAFLNLKHNSYRQTFSSAIQNLYSNSWKTE